MVTETKDLFLRVVREHLGDSGTTFRREPRRLSGGAFSEVFGFQLFGVEGAWAEPLVVRVYALGENRVQPRVEQALQNGCADGGFPAPRILLTHDARELGDRMFVIMERLAGRGFLRGIRWDQFLRDFPRVLTSWPRVLNRVAARLHAVDAASVLRSAQHVGLATGHVSALRHLDFVYHHVSLLGAAQEAETVAWLDANRPTEAAVSVVHGDLWPANVLMRRGELTGVVDWNVAGLGDPALDIGFAKAGLALMPAPFPPPPPVAQAVHAAGRSIARRIHETYRSQDPKAAERVPFYEGLRCLLELSIVLRYRARVTEGDSVERRPPWDNGVKALTKYFAEISGIRLQLPAALA